MTELNPFKTRQLSAVQNVLTLRQPQDRGAVLVRNRVRERTTQRILSSEDIASSPFLEGKKNLLRLQQDFPLTEVEGNALEDGVNDSKRSSLSLQTFRLRRVVLLGSLRANLVEIQPTNKGSH